MTLDPVIEAIYKCRENHVSRTGDDLDAIVADLRGTQDRRKNVAQLKPVRPGRCVVESSALRTSIDEAGVTIRMGN